METDMPVVELYRQLNTKQAAAFLGTCTATLERRRREGVGPRYVRIKANHVRYRIKDLIEYQEQHLVEAPDE